MEAMKKYINYLWYSTKIVIFAAPVFLLFMQVIQYVILMITSVTDPDDLSVKLRTVVEFEFILLMLFVLGIGLMTKFYRIAMYIREDRWAYAVAAGVISVLMAVVFSVSYYLILNISYSITEVTLKYTFDTQGDLSLISSIAISLFAIMAGLFIGGLYEKLQVGKFSVIMGILLIGFIISSIMNGAAIAQGSVERFYMEVIWRWLVQNPIYTLVLAIGSGIAGGVCIQKSELRSLKQL